MEMSKSRSEFDTPWKKILDIYFKDFVAYCWPEQYKEIDWSKGYKMLDKELSKIAKNAATTNRVADKLVEIFRFNGKEAFVLIHIEVQGQFDPEFEERMFIYRYRLRDLHKSPIASLAVLIDPDQKWRPSSFREELWGSSIEMRFPIIKLVDYRSRIEELELAKNLFAPVILAQLKALEKKSPDAKLVSKIDLIRCLFKQGRQKEDVNTLLMFIDWVFTLPATLEQKCQDTIKMLEEELTMDYRTDFPPRPGGIFDIARLQGESTMLLCLLEEKFNTIPESYRQKIKEAKADSLLKWAKRVLKAQNLEDVFVA